MISLTSWWKCRALADFEPAAIAALLARHPELSRLTSQEARALELSRRLACSLSTARGMLQGTGQGRKLFGVVTANCGGEALKWGIAAELRARTLGRAA